MTGEHTCKYWCSWCQWTGDKSDLNWIDRITPKCPDCGEPVPVCKVCEQIPGAKDKL